jgi:hypothetical protein
MAADAAGFIAPLATATVKNQPKFIQNHNEISLRDLIQRMSRENALWGASRIHGELLMLGFQVAQSTVSKYMVRCQNPVADLEDFSAKSR